MQSVTTNSEYVIQLLLVQQYAQEKKKKKILNLVNFITLSLTLSILIHISETSAET